GLFRWYMKADGVTDRIEERVVLFEANSFDHALNLAEVEAAQYCLSDEQANYCIEPTGWWHAYWLGATPASGVEVFSRGAHTQLGNQAFIRRYYPKSHSAGTKQCA
ncbi:MAG: hypothetical protein ABWY06_22305, partial [Pseudomonas sp.]|uniref:hypothetical protein n=1 Tax=Pseudomonas sp. TaxID=306 RepID=UPI0033955579